MAFERREILFTLPEIRDALMAVNSGRGDIPVHPDMRIIEALHTRDNHLYFHVVRDRFAKIYKQCLGKPGVMFRAQSISGSSSNDIFEFFVHEDVMLQTILYACKRSNVMLPRTPNKNIIAEDLYIGFQFEMGQTAQLVLEEA
jgi:hypothetical protein